VIKLEELDGMEFSDRFASQQLFIGENEDCKYRVLRFFRIRLE